MNPASWLSNKDIETFAAELLTPEYKDRISERLEYLNKNHGSSLIAGIINSLNRYEIRVNKYIHDVNKIKINPKDIIFDENTNYKEFEDSMPRILLYGYNTSITGIRGDIKPTEISIIKSQVINYLDKLSNKNKNLVKEDEKETQPESFQNLFYSDRDLYKYLDILRDVSKEEGKVIFDDNYKFIGGKKTIIIGWIEALEEKGKLKINVDYNTKSKLLNKFLKKPIFLEEDSLWRKNNSLKYKEIFKKII